MLLSSKAIADAIRLTTKWAVEDLRKKNNPKNEPVGIFTGRCKHCHSADLWDDNMAYGCNCCGALLGTNN